MDDISSAADGCADWLLVHVAGYDDGLYCGRRLLLRFRWRSLQRKLSILASCAGGGFLNIRKFRCEVMGDLYPVEVV